MKRSATDHPKVANLADAIADHYKHQRRFALLIATGILERLWHFTAKFAPRGDIGRRRDDEICRWVGWPIDESLTLINILIRTEWLLNHPVHRLIVHDWHEHADESVKKLLQRKKLTFACLDMSGLVSPSLLPEPKPEPKPVPIGTPDKPRPPRPQPESLLPVERHLETEDLVTALIDSHPQHRRGKRSLSEQIIADITNGDPGKIRQLAERHSEWRDYWADQPGQFTPSLPRWLAEGSWRDPPPERPEDPVMKIAREEDERRAKQQQNRAVG